MPCGEVNNIKLKSGMNQANTKLNYSSEVLKESLGDCSLVVKKAFMLNAQGKYQCNHCSEVIALPKDCIKHAMTHGLYPAESIASHFEVINVNGSVRRKRCDQEMTMKNAEVHYKLAKCQQNGRHDSHSVPAQNNSIPVKFANTSQSFGTCLPEERKTQMEIEDLGPEKIQIGSCGSMLNFRPDEMDYKGLARQIANQIYDLAKERDKTGEFGFKCRVYTLLEKSLQELETRWNLREESFQSWLQEVRNELTRKDKDITHQGERITRLEKELSQVVKFKDLRHYISQLMQQNGGV